VCGAQTLYGSKAEACAPGASIDPALPASSGVSDPGVSGLMTAGPGAIRFTLGRPGPVSAGVYDLAGRLVYKFPTLHLEAGRHTLRWGGLVGDGDGASPGLYFVRVRLADGASASTKVLWAR
jgi:hypothetical protein